MQPTKQNNPPNSPQTHMGAKRPHLSFEPKLKTPTRGIVRMWENTACTERPRAEGKRNCGLGKTWPCHHGRIAGPPLSGLPKIPWHCEPHILRTILALAGGQPPFYVWAASLHSHPGWRDKETYMPHLPELAAPRHHPLISFPHWLGVQVHGHLCRPGGARTVAPLFFLLCSLSHLVLTHTSGQHSGLIISKAFSLF